MTARLDWSAILPRAAGIVTSYNTGVTLRQLFYRLVADGTLANTNSNYKSLSRHTAKARREGTFPGLVDRGRTIHRDLSFDGPDDARDWLTVIYRRDRTMGQGASVYLGVEKAGLVAQLRSWFGDLGVPILALGGYGSQTYTDQVADDVDRSARPAVLLYAGDFDPSGEDLDRDFVARTGCWAAVERVALTADQVEEFDLPPAVGKASDSRASAFLARHGQLVQVELDALAPDTLHGLYAEALAPWWDTSTYEAVLVEESAERAELASEGRR